MVEIKHKHRHHKHHHSHRHESKWKLILKYVLVAVNVITAVMMVFCTFCGTLPPQNYPKLSVLPLLFPYLLLINILMLISWLFIKRKWAVISLSAMLLSITDIRGYFPLNLPNNAPQGCLKVMSYNVGKVKKEQVEELVTYLESVNPDILCLQECSKSLKLTEDSTIQKIFPYIDINEERSASTVCLSKYPIVDNHFIEYDSKSNSSVSYDIALGNDTLMIVNNHFQSYQFNLEEISEYKEITSRNASISAREKGTKNIVSKIISGNKRRGPQVDIVYDYIEKHGRNYIIALGDFNEPTMSYAHYKLTKILKDAYTRSGNGLGLTYSRDKIYYRIDHILCSDNIIPYEAEVDKEATFSDHYPIFCYIKLQ